MQLTIYQIEAILRNAKELKKSDSSLSETIEIELIQDTDLYFGGSTINAYIKSNYSECNSIQIY